FAGEFSLDAADAVGSGDGIDPDDVLDLLGNLVAKSMVVAVATGEATRYRLLETLRQYALERLEAAAEGDLVRARHAAYYADVVGIAGRGMRGADEPGWVHRIEAELDNLRAAVQWASDTEQFDLALSLFAPLWFLPWFGESITFEL